VHLQLHAARRADLVREADRERLIRTLKGPRNRRGPAASTPLQGDPLPWYLPRGWRIVVVAASRWLGD